ncbi:MAG: sugar O-acetyltransferase [Spirochaetales bacterium]|nr:sugar O-acetyltransferase [Spirochaetales bacterium]
MTEKEKMLNGDYYDASDEVLVQDRLKARKLIYKFNNTQPHEYNERTVILSRLMNTKETCFIEPPFRCDYGYNIHTGKNFYANFNCTMLDCNKILIGDNVKLGPNVQIYTATHPIDYKARNQGKEMAYRIIIGDNVWIGGGTIICPGVKIGKNTTIGAGSVVVNDIPDNVVAVGNPCRVIKKL